MAVHYKWARCNMRHLGSKKRRLWSWIEGTWGMSEIIWGVRVDEFKSSVEMLRRGKKMDLKKWWDVDVFSSAATSKDCLLRKALGVEEPRERPWKKTLQCERRCWSISLCDSQLALPLEKIQRKNRERCWSISLCDSQQVLPPVSGRTRGREEPGGEFSNTQHWSPYDKV